MSSSDTLKLFFDKMWGDEEGYVHLPNRSPDQTWHKVFWKWPNDKEKVIKYVLLKTSQQHEVFFAPAMYKQPGAASNNNIIGTRVLWADFDDGSAPIDWAKVAETVPEPSLRVQTSEPGNEHVYWMLNKFTDDLDFVESANRSIAYTLNSDPACWNAARLLRPPVSINFGYTKPERQGKIYDVVLKEYSDREYDGVVFSHFKPIKVLVNESLTNADDIPSVNDIMMDCLWTPELKKIFRKSPGDFGPPPHDRSTNMVRMAFEAAESGWNDKQIYALICDADDRWGKYRDRTDKEFQRASIIDRVRRKIPFLPKASISRG